MSTHKYNICRHSSPMNFKFFENVDGIVSIINLTNFEFVAEGFDIDLLIWAYEEKIIKVKDSAGIEQI